MAKQLPATALKKTYDALSYASNGALSLRTQIKTIITAAPKTSKRIGITNKDIIEIRRIEVKLSKLRDQIYGKQEVD